MATNPTLGQLQNQEFALRVAEAIGSSGIPLKLTAPIRPKGRTLLKDYADKLDRIRMGSAGGDVKTLAESGADQSTVEKAYETYKKSKERAAVGGPGKSKSIISRIEGLSGDVLGQAAHAVGQSLDYLSRPGQAVSAVIEDRIKGVNEALRDGISWKDAGELYSNTIGLPFLDKSQLGAFGSGIVGHNREGGQGILREYGNLLGDTFGYEGTRKLLSKEKPSVLEKIAKGAAGFGLDVATDPTTYVGAGLVRAAAKGAVTAKTLEAAGMVPEAARSAELTIEALEQGPKAGLRKGLKRFNPGDIKAVAQAAMDETQKAYHIRRSKITRQLYTDTFNAATKSGALATDARNAAKQAVSDFIKSKMDEAAKIAQDKLEHYGRRKLAVNVGVRQEAKRDILAHGGWAENMFDPLRSASAAVKSKFGAAGALENAFSLEKAFPGMTQAMRRIASSKGLAGANAFRKEMRELFYGVTKEERELMAHAIEGGYDLAPRQVARRAGGSVDINDIKAEVQHQLRKMGHDDVTSGLRNAKDIVDDTYMYHYYRKRKAAKLADEFRGDRKKLLQAHNTTPITHTLKAAKAQGLDPETDVWRILLAKQAKGGRDHVRHYFETEALKQYARAFKQPIRDPESHGLVKLDLNKDVRSTLWKQQWKNKHVYMPKEYKAALDNFQKFTKLDNSDEVNAFIRTFDKVNRWFKFSRTIPRPAYHVNNMLFDGLTGWFDGVRAKDWNKTMWRWAATTKGGKALGMKLKPFVMQNGNELGFDESWNLFKKYGQGGNFPNLELPLGETTVTGEGLKGAGRTILSGVRRGSEMREDAGRFVHFQKGLDQELFKAAKGKKLSGQALDDALKEAAMNASQRVNYSHVDYMGLTPFEQQYMRRIVPFYTFARRATPMMVETALLNPGKFTAFEKGKRALETAFGVKNEDPTFDNIRWPEWLGGAASYLQLGNGPEPDYLDFSNILPQNFLQQQFGASTGQEVAADQLSRISPFMRGPFEFAFGKQLFGNRKIDSPLQQLSREFAPWSPIQGTLDRKSSEYKFQNLFGIPIRNLSEEQQVAAIKKATAPSSTTIGRLTKAMEAKGIEISTSRRKNGTVYRLLDRIHGRELGVYKTPAEAQEAANALFG